MPTNKERLPALRCDGLVRRFWKWRMSVWIRRRKYAEWRMRWCRDPFTREVVHHNQFAKWRQIERTAHDKITLCLVRTLTSPNNQGVAHGPNTKTSNNQNQ